MACKPDILVHCGQKKIIKLKQFQEAKTLYNTSTVIQIIKILILYETIKVKSGTFFGGRGGRPINN